MLPGRLIALRLATALVLSLVLAVALSAKSAGSREVEAQPSVTPGSQRYPDVATNGRDYFVVWQDERFPGQTRVYGARVTSGGRVLDPGGISIGTATLNQYAPSVGWDGRNYIVTWINGNGDPETEDVMAARVSSSGRVLDQAPISVTTAPHGQGPPELAWTGTSTLVVWQDARAGDAVGMWGTLIDRRGHVLRPNGFQLVPGEEGGNPRVGCSRRRCLVAWGYDRLRGARIAAGGTVLDRNGFSIIGWSPAGMPFDPVIASGGRDWLVLWRQEWNDRERAADISAIHVTRSGKRRERAPIRVVSAGWYQMDPDVAWTGANYLVVFADDRTASWDIAAVRLSVGGRRLDRKPIRIHPGFSRQEYPAVAWNGRNSLVVWQGSSTSPSDIYGARVTRSGRVLERRDPTWGDRLLISVGSP
jgi:hypothetical protein